MRWTSVFFRSVERTKLPALIPRRTRRILQTSPTNSRIRILARKSDAGYTLHRETTREHRKPFGSHHTGIYRKNSQRVWRDRLPHPLPARPRRHDTIRKNRIFPATGRRTRTRRQANTTRPAHTSAEKQIVSSIN